MLLQLVKTENEKYGQYYLLIAEKYYEKGLYQKAKSFYQTILTKMKQFMTKIDIWIKYGNCCKYLNETDNAINAYRNAVNLDSSNCEAAVLLVELLKNNILLDEASNVIRTSKLKYSLYSFFNLKRVFRSALNHEKSKTLTHEVRKNIIKLCLLDYFNFFR